jgi:hypothetical protein
MVSNFKKKHKELYTILEQKNYREKEELDSYVHALLDIEESIDKIFNVHIKSIIEHGNDSEIIQDKIWDIREEFRHIYYHINDGKLME